MGRPLSSNSPMAKRCSTTADDSARPPRPLAIVSSYLWSRGITHLDAIVISHADADHYNALPAMLEQFSVGIIYVSPVMFDDPSSAARASRARGHR